MGLPREVLHPDPTTYKTKYPLLTTLGLGRVARSRSSRREGWEGKCLHLLPVYHSLPGPSECLLSPTSVGHLSSEQLGPSGAIVLPSGARRNYARETDQNRGQRTIKCSPPCRSLTVPSPLGVQEGPAGPRRVGKPMSAGRRQVPRRKGRHSQNPMLPPGQKLSKSGPGVSTAQREAVGKTPAEAGCVHNERERPSILIVSQLAGTRQLRARSLSEPIHLPRKKKNPPKAPGPCWTGPRQPCWT